jgi:hypothetical protein
MFTAIDGSGSKKLDSLPSAKTETGETTKPNLWGPL